MALMNSLLKHDFTLLRFWDPGAFDFKQVVVLPLADSDLRHSSSSIFFVFVSSEDGNSGSKVSACRRRQQNYPSRRLRQENSIQYSLSIRTDLQKRRPTRSFKTRIGSFLEDVYTKTDEKKPTDISKGFKVEHVIHQRAFPYGSRARRNVRRFVLDIWWMEASVSLMA